MTFTFDIHEESNDFSANSKIKVDAQIHNDQHASDSPDIFDYEKEPLLLSSKDDDIITIPPSPQIPVSKKTLKNRKRNLRRKQKRLHSKSAHTSTSKKSNEAVQVYNEIELRKAIIETVVESYRDAIQQLVTYHFLSEANSNVPAFLGEQSVIKASFMSSMQTLLDTEIGTKIPKGSTADSK